MKLRAQAVVLPKERYSYYTIVWESQEGNILRADQMKPSPSVMMWGGMMRHGLTDFHFVMQEIYKLTPIITSTTTLIKTLKPAKFCESCFVSQTTGCSNRMVQDVTRHSNQFDG